MAAAKNQGGATGGSKDVEPVAPPATTPDATPPKDATPTTTGQSKAEEAAELKAKLSSVAAENADLRKQNEALQAKLDGALKEIASARQKLESKGASTLGDLGSESYELLQSVVIPDHQGTTVNARRGDVVTLLKDIDELDRKVGSKAKVFRVSKVTINELGELKFLRA